MARFTSHVAALCLMVAFPRLQAGCPAGEGYPSANVSTCVLCGAGTWSGEGSAECTRCPPGTWSSVTGAVDAGTCVRCPRGTWSSQMGSPTQDSCQGCSPGRWGGADGLAGDSQCTACSPGTWAAEHGATSDEVCTACAPGKWSSQVGSSSAAHCIDCAPGTWNDESGASALQSCKPCGAGTWSAEWGASSKSTCTGCEVGTYQPAVGQANQSVCIRCPPGKYTAVTGESTCAPCPAGSWNDDFEKTECNICPEGKWTHSSGALRAGDCTPCAGGAGCMPDSSARITMDFKNFPYAELDEQQLAEIEAAIAEALASACSIDNQSVVDLFGKSTSVTISPDGTVSAFATEVTGASANELAARLYSLSFRGEVVNSTLAILGSGVARFGIGAISVKPEAFVPLMPTSTVTTTTVSSSTVTTTAATTTTVEATTVEATTVEATTVEATTTQTRPQHKDATTEPPAETEPTSKASIQAAAALPWSLMLCLGLTASGSRRQL
mmetsp:Transcript_38916/g.97772  ORF Transcript_38916/g.97772 Transcript_38916/m.97772 type:complete len:497 (-) Transcript_38916:201-1691(-)